MRRIKILFSILWLTLLCSFGYYIFDYSQTHDTSTFETIRILAAQIQLYIESAGLLAGLIYILIYTFRPLIFFPTSVLTPLSAVLFGPLLGWIFTYIGENFSASVAFFASRFLGGETFSRFKILKKFDSGIEKAPLLTVLFLRLVPLFPFDFVNYGMGLTKIQYKWYSIGTALGVIPGLTAYIFLGSSITEPKFLIPTILLFVLLGTTSYILKRRSTLSNIKIDKNTSDF